jgi:hypothetical protein
MLTRGYSRYAPYGAFLTVAKIQFFDKKQEMLARFNVFQKISLAPPNKITPCFSRKQKKRPATKCPKGQFLKNRFVRNQSIKIIEKTSKYHF